MVWERQAAYINNELDANNNKDNFSYNQFGVHQNNLPLNAFIHPLRNKQSNEIWQRRLIPTDTPSA